MQNSWAFFRHILLSRSPIKCSIICFEKSWNIADKKNCSSPILESCNTNKFRRFSFEKRINAFVCAPCNSIYSHSYTEESVTQDTLEWKTTKKFYSNSKEFRSFFFLLLILLDYVDMCKSYIDKFNVLCVFVWAILEFILMSFGQLHNEPTTPPP